ncbi:MAG: hypothetical protein IAF38_13485 [Bacteroidia bacterium]|nr:hypothetical protein [Bacteroidia bacterium]
MSLLFVLFSGAIFSQTTISNDTAKKSVFATNPITTKHKILVLPFNNKMYMSEIDHVINAETKQNQKEIRWGFKDGIDEQLCKKLKSKYDVVSLIEDTVKNKKEIGMVIAGVNYSYDKVPVQEKYKAPKSDYKQENQVKKGQIADEVNYDARFMNAKIRDKELLTSLNKKYKTDVFVFVNELDLKAPPMVNGDLAADKNRTAVIHYTVFNLAGKEINSGTVSVKFPKNANSPDKISSSYISKAMEEIAARVDKALNPPSLVTGK